MSNLNNEDGRTVAMILKSYRKDKGITLQEVGDRVGTGKQYIHSIEKGRSFVSIAQAANFAESLGENKLIWVQAALQDMANRSNFNFIIKMRE